MSHDELRASVLGRELFDQALVKLGELPARENGSVREEDPIILDIPNVVLERTGVAPLRFIFGSNLDIWVGPFSEVVTLEAEVNTSDQVCEALQRVMRSAVTVGQTRLFSTIALQVPGEDPWVKLKVLGRGHSRGLTGVYRPFVGQSAG